MYAIIKNKFLSILFITLACVLVIACSKKTPEAQAKAASKSKYELLEFIPADSPYFFGGIEAAPEEVLEKFAGIYEEMLDAYWEMFKAGFANEGGDISELADSDNPWFKAIGLEFYANGEVNKDVFKNFGLSMKSTGGIYGHGLAPVLRIKLSDAERLKKTIARIEKNAGEKIPTLDLDGKSVWNLVFDNSDAQLVFDIQSDYFVASLAPAPEDIGTKPLKQLLGLEKPKSSLADSKYLNQIMREKNYLPYAIGFIDAVKASEPFIEGPSGLNEILFSLSDYEMLPHEELSDICKKEFREIIQIAPRLLFGTSKYDTDDMNMEYLLELRPDIAKQVADLTAPVPGLGEASGLFSMGFSFNIENMQKFALSQIHAIKKDPFECDKLQELNENMLKMEAQVNNPAAGFIQGLRGVNFVIDDFDDEIIGKLMDLEDQGLSNPDKKDFIMQQLQEDLGGYALVSVDNSKNLYNLAKMFSPEVAQLDLKADGKPRLINDALPEAPPFDIYATMQDQAFVLTAGKNAGNKAKKVSALKARGNAPLFAYSINYDLYLQAMQSMFDNPKMAEAMQDGDTKGVQNLEALKKILSASYGFFDTGTIKLNLREDGVAFEYEIAMK